MKEKNQPLLGNGGVLLEDADQLTEDELSVDYIPNKESEKKE